VANFFIKKCYIYIEQLYYVWYIVNACPGLHRISPEVRFGGMWLISPRTRAGGWLNPLFTAGLLCKNRKKMKKIVKNQKKT
jgi:hypothetical protein